MQERGFVAHTRDVAGRFELRILRQGRAVYGLDLWLGDESFGDNALCFYDGGGVAGSRGSTTATGSVEWDKTRGAAVVRLLNFSLLPEIGGDFRMTPAELADAIWDKLCQRVEDSSR